MRKFYPVANLNKLAMMVLYILSKGTPDQNLEHIFRIFDINDDHEICRSEMKKIVNDLFALLSTKELQTVENDTKMADDAFTEMDVDRDGKVTKEEFIQTCLSHENISSMMARKITDMFIPDEDSVDEHNGD